MKTIIINKCHNGYIVRDADDKTGDLTQMWAYSSYLELQLGLKELLEQQVMEDPTCQRNQRLNPKIMINGTQLPSFPSQNSQESQGRSNASITTDLGTFVS